MNRCAEEFVPYTHQYRGGGLGYNYRSKNKVYWNRGSEKLVSIQAILNQKELVKQAVASLYSDRIRPEMQTLKKRLEELDLYGAFDGKVREEVLRFACEKLDFLIVGPENDVKGRERIVAHFRHAWDVPEGFESFVDAMNGDDSKYPESLWNGMSEYIHKLSSTDDKQVYTFPGGRYGMARRLIEENHDFLEGLVLGEVCHVVQLLLEKKVIAYGRQGHVVPFEKSVSALKATNAQLLQPTFVSPDGLPTCADETGRPNLVIKNMDELVQVMESILYPEVDTLHPRTLLLSNLKAEIRERFALELSETSLGVTKLAELLKKPQLIEVCEVSWRKNNPVLLPHPNLRLKGPSHPLLAPRPQWLKMVVAPQPYQQREDMTNALHHIRTPSTYALPPPQKITEPFALPLVQPTTEPLEPGDDSGRPDAHILSNAFEMLGGSLEYECLPERPETKTSAADFMVVPNTMDMTNYDYFPASDDSKAIPAMSSPLMPVVAHPPVDGTVIRIAAEAAAELAARGVTDQAAIEVLVQEKLKHVSAPRLGAVTRSPTCSPERKENPKKAEGPTTSPDKAQSSNGDMFPGARVANTFLTFKTEEEETRNPFRFHSWAFPADRILSGDLSDL